MASAGSPPAAGKDPPARLATLPAIAPRQGPGEERPELSPAARASRIERPPGGSIRAMDLILILLIVLLIFAAVGGGLWLTPFLWLLLILALVVVVVAVLARRP